MHWSVNKRLRIVFSERKETNMIFLLLKREPRLSMLLSLNWGDRVVNLGSPWKLKFVGRVLERKKPHQDRILDREYLGSFDAKLHMDCLRLHKTKQRNSFWSSSRLVDTWILMIENPEIKRMQGLFNIQKIINVTVY